MRTGRLLNNKTVKNAGWIIAGKVMQMVLSFFISILTARFLGPSNYGIINYVNAFFAVFSSICTLGLENIIVKELVAAPDQQGETMGTVILLETICSVLCIISMTALIGIANEFSRLYMVISLLYSLSLLFRGIESINYWFQYKLLSKVSSIAGIIAYIFMSAYRVFLLATNKSIEWFALSNTIDAIVLAALLFIVFRRNFKGRLSFSLSKAGKLLSKSYHYILAGIMIMIYLQTDKIMLKHMVDEATVGNYAVATRITTIWVFVLTAITDSVRPTLFAEYGRDRTSFFNKLQMLYSVILYVSFAVAVFFLLFGDFVILKLYGENYIQSALFIKIISWGTGFSYVGNARNIYSLSNGLEKYEKHMALIGMLLNIVLNYVLIRRIGAKGAAVATVVTQIFINYIVMFLIKPLKENGMAITRALNPLSAIRFAKGYLNKE